MSIAVDACASIAITYHMQAISTITTTATTTITANNIAKTTPPA